MKGFLEWLKFLKSIFPLILVMLGATLIFGFLAIVFGLADAPAIFPIGFCIVAVIVDWFGISVIIKLDTPTKQKKSKITVMDATGPKPVKPKKEVVIREAIYVESEKCFMVID